MWFSDALKWLAGSMAAVSALLYAAGFLAIQAHLNLLGVSRIVDVPTADFLMEGGRFFALLPLFLLAGMVLLSPLLLVLLVLRRHVEHRPRVLMPILLTSEFVMLSVMFNALPASGVLLRDRSGKPEILGALTEMGEIGYQIELVVYSVALAGAVLAVAVAIWSWRRAHLGWRPLPLWTKATHFCFLTLTGFLVLCMPVLFGTLAHPLRFPYVEVRAAKESRDNPWQGYLLNHWTGSESTVVVYRPKSDLDSPKARDILVLPKGSVESVRYVKEDYLIGEWKR